jgi:signal recognition particle subunit SRP54
VDPQETLFVVDAMVGQDAVTTAQAFRDGVGFTGVVLTKLDGDARGGAALSVREVTGQPIMFASNGEGLTEFDVFHPDRMASRILGMGDMLTLIEQAERTFDAAETERMAAKVSGGMQNFTLEDFLEQLQAIRRMGPIGNLLGMLPGMGQMKDAISQIDDRDLDRTAAIIRSMTPSERENPKMINGSRRLRIANGSGVRVNDVNTLVDRFFEARKLMGQMPGFGRAAAGGMQRRSGKNARNNKKGGKGRQSGRGPTKARTPAGLGGLPPGALGGLGGAGGAGGFGAGLPPQLPPGMKMPDLSKLNLPKQ